MTAADLIDRLRSIGATVAWAQGQPAMTFPTGTMTPELRAELAGPLAEHRQAVLAALEEPTRELTCDECKADVYVWREDYDTAFQLCRRSMCPFWREGIGPPWIENDRYWAKRKRQEKAVQDERASEPIPD